MPQVSVKRNLTAEENVFAQKAAKKQALMNVIIEAMNTQKAGKGNAGSANQLYAMIQELAEGSSCNSTEQITITKGNCPLGTPPDQMLTFDKSNVEPRRLDHGPFCQISSDLAGYSIPSGSTKQMFDLYEGTIYAPNFKVNVDWGICLCNVRPGMVQIDCNLSNVTSSNAQEVIDEFTFVCKYADSLKTDPSYFHYNSICAIEAHENSHNDDYKEKVAPYYDEIVKRINKIEPIHDWCKLSPSELGPAKTQKFNEASEIVKEVYDKIEKEIDQNADFNYKSDQKAIKTEIIKINQIIDDIKTKFHIQ